MSGKARKNFIPKTIVLTSLTACMKIRNIIPFLAQELITFGHAWYHFPLVPIGNWQVIPQYGSEHDFPFLMNFIRFSTKEADTLELYNFWMQSLYGTMPLNHTKYRTFWEHTKAFLARQRWCADNHVFQEKAVSSRWACSLNSWSELGPPTSHTTCYYVDLVHSLLDWHHSDDTQIVLSEKD